MPTPTHDERQKKPNGAGLPAAAKQATLSLLERKIRRTLKKLLSFEIKEKHIEKVMA